MKFKYLGTAAAEGIPALFCKCERCVVARRTGGKNIRSRTQAIVDGSLIIDWPPDAFMHMAQNGIDYTDIESVIITHIHEDHYYPQDFGNRRKWFAMLDDKTPQLVDNTHHERHEQKRFSQERRHALRPWRRQMRFGYDAGRAGCL